MQTYIRVYIYIYIYIYIYYKHIYIYIQHVMSCAQVLSCNKAIVVITRSAHQYIYIQMYQ